MIYSAFARKLTKQGNFGHSAESLLFKTRDGKVSDVPRYRSKCKSDLEIMKQFV